MSYYPLTSKLDNGASVSDWLGTAGVAAKLAAHFIEKVRDEETPDPIMHLAAAIEQLEQALAEARIVQTHVAHVAAFIPGESLGERKVRTGSPPAVPGGKWTEK